MGQVGGIRRVVRRAWRVMIPGMCHRFGRSVLGFARAGGCWGRESFWNQRTRVSARATMWSQSRLGAKRANGKRLPPWSLMRAMWVSTRAWARMSRSDSAAVALLSDPVSPVSPVVGVEEGSSRSGMFGFASDDEPEAFFGPSVGFGMVAEFYHLGTRRGRFPVFGPVVGAGNLRSLRRVVDSRGAVWGWFGLGKGRCLAWVVGGDVAEGFGDPVRGSSDETEPDACVCGIR